jgi:hypothetical protein
MAATRYTLNNTVAPDPGGTLALSSVISRFVNVPGPTGATHVAELFEDYATFWDSGVNPNGKWWEFYIKRPEGAYVPLESIYVPAWGSFFGWTLIDSAGSVYTAAQSAWWTKNAGYLPDGTFPADEWVRVRIEHPAAASGHTISFYKGANLHSGAAFATFGTWDTHTPDLANTSDWSTGAHFIGNNSATLSAFQGYFSDLVYGSTADAFPTRSAGDIASVGKNYVGMVPV